MSKRKRRYFPPDQKVSILKEHLLDGLPISEVCEKHEIRPGLFKRWQKKFFENGDRAFRSDKNTRQQRAQKKKIERLQEKVSEKDEIIAEVAEAFVTLKKDIGAT